MGGRVGEGLDFGGRGIGRIPSAFRYSMSRFTMCNDAGRQTPDMNEFHSPHALALDEANAWLSRSRSSPAEQTPSWPRPLLE